MAELNLPNIREGGNIRFRIGLEDGGVAVDWSGLEDIRVFLYADAQKQVSGEMCEVAVDEEDNTVLKCKYSGDDVQYRGINSVLVRAKYLGEIKVYDKPAINIVARTSDATGVVEIDDPVVPVQISVEDVSTSLLNNAIDAAINAAAEAEKAAHLVPLQVLEDCVEATGKALEAASKAPYIDETTGNWFVWDAEAGEYVDSGKTARGATGNGIDSWSVVESSEDAGNNVVTVTFTDGTSESFNVKNGHTGNGIASIVQTVESPDDAGTNVITITMTNGTVVTFNVKNGSKGTPGVAQAAYKSVSSLPTASAQTMDKIYLTPSGTSGVYNMSYTEFDGSAYSWQDLGTTAIQLSDYATKAELDQLEAKVDDLQDDFENAIGAETVLTPTVESDSYINSTGTIVTGDSSWKLFKYSLGGASKIRVSAGTPAAQSTPYCSFYSDAAFTSVVGTPFKTNTIAGQTVELTVPTGANYFAGSIVFNKTVDVSTIIVGTVDTKIEQIDTKVNSVLNVTQLRGYYQCSSAADASMKVISGDYLSLSYLTTGSHFLLLMQNALTATFAEININNLGAKRIWYNGAAANKTNSWEAGEMLDIYFDGTQFQAVNFASRILVEKVSSRTAAFDVQGYIGRNGKVYTNSAYKRTRYIPYFSGNKYKIKGYEGQQDNPSSICACACYDNSKAFIGAITGFTAGVVEFILDDNNVLSNTAYIILSCYVDYGGYIEALSTYDVLRELYRLDDALNDRIQEESLKLIKANNWEQDAAHREKFLRQKFVDSGEAEHWYGVQWGEDDDPNNVTPIYSTGDSSLHTTLPIQNKIRRCVIKDEIVQYYLDSNNSELKADGTPATLDGTDGNVMVEVPEFFFKCEEEIVDGVNVVRLKISEQGLPGFQFSRKVYTSAYEATIDRTKNILASVCTTTFTRATEEVQSEGVGSYIVGTAYSYGQQKTALRNGFSSNATNFRGGTNDDTLDGETDPSDVNYSRNQLGIPVSNINRVDCRALSDKDHNIFCDQYDTQKKLWILAQVEFKTRNIQKPISSGGMGMGATVYPDYASYEAFFSPQRGIACLPCGITNVLGNNTGEVYFKMINVPVSSTGTGAEIVYNRFADVWMPVMSYRGIENFYGHIYDIVDGINVRTTNVNEYVEGHSGDTQWQLSEKTYYYEPNPFLTDDSENPDKSLGTYKFASNVMSVSKLMLGKDAHILHIGTNGKNMEENYCDASELLNNTRLEFITFNGRIVSGRLVGFHFIVAADAANGFSTRPSDGTRLNMF